MARVRVTVNQSELGRTIYGSGSQAQRFLDEKAQQLARNVRTNAPKSTGGLASSVRVEDTSGLDLQFGRPNFTGTTRGKRIVVDHQAAKAVETGTGPGHETLNGVPSPNPPYWPIASEELVSWALREAPELIRVNKNGTLNLYLLQKAIHDRGTKAHHFVLKSLKETFPRAQGDFSRE